jgi:hypothetical protein
MFLQKNLEGFHQQVVIVSQNDSRAFHDVFSVSVKTATAGSTGILPASSFFSSCKPS